MDSASRRNRREIHLIINCQEEIEIPLLYNRRINEGVEEIYNFAQDDMLTEDIYLRSLFKIYTHAELFVWVGQCVDSKEKQTVADIGEKYINLDASLEGLSPKVPLYKINEGNEPCFFTTFFTWDPSKAIVQGNSFQKKAVMLFGTHHAVEDKFNSGNQGPRQMAEALAALNSALNFSSNRPAYSSQDRSNEGQEASHETNEE